MNSETSYIAQEGRFLEPIRIKDKIESINSTLNEYGNQPDMEWLIKELTQEKPLHEEQYISARNKEKTLDSIFSRAQTLNSMELDRIEEVMAQMVSAGAHVIDIVEMRETIAKRLVQIGVGEEDLKVEMGDNAILQEYKRLKKLETESQNRIPSEIVEALDYKDVLRQNSIQAHTVPELPKLIESLKGYKLESILENAEVRCLGVGLEEGVVYEVTLGNGGKIAIKLFTIPNIKLANDLYEVTQNYGYTRQRFIARFHTYAMRNKTSQEVIKSAGAQHLAHTLSPEFADGCELVVSNEEPIGLVMPSYTHNSSNIKTEVHHASELDAYLSKEQKLRLIHEGNKWRRAGLVDDIGQRGTEPENIATMVNTAGENIIKYFDMRLKYAELLNYTPQEILTASTV